MSDRPVVLLAVADGEAEEYRGYCLRSVAAVYDVVLISPQEPTWEKPFIIDHEVADLGDSYALTVAGQALAARHQLAGVLTWTEWHLVPVARLARQLGLPTVGPEVMNQCRNKAISRFLFARHGVPSAASATARTLVEAAVAAETIGYPVVLKPASQAGSIGVIRINGPEDLPGGYAFASSGASHGVESTQVLVEEFLDGPEISVECVTFHGRTTVVAVTRKTVGMDPYFEELAHLVDAADLLIEAVAPVARAAIKALGVSEGVSHVEMRLVEGRPRLIEVNARIAGDMIGHLVHLATGIDLPRAAADIACGQAPDLTPTRSQAAAIRLIYPATSGTLTNRRMDPEFAADTAWLERVVFQRHPGDQLILPPDGNLFTARIGYLVVTAPTAELAQQRSHEAYRHLNVSIAQ